MRVCLIAHRFYETNTHMRQFAAAFTERGDVVDVISIGRKGAPRYERVNDVNVYRIQTREVDEHGPVDYLAKMLTFMFRTAVFLGRRHLKNRYDLIHVQSIPDFLVFAALVPRLMGTKVILDLRDLVPELYVSKFSVGTKALSVRLLRFVEMLSAYFANHVIVANPIWHERIISRSAKSSKASVFWYYPDRKLFYPRNNPRRDGKFVIMYPGSLSWHQGLDVAIRAFQGIAREIPEAELHIQGDGTEKPRLIALSQELGLSDKVRFYDPVPTTEVVERMATADVAIVPKRTGCGFGNEAASTKISEFMAMGIPVVATRTDIEACFFDDSLVRYFPSEDVAGLADAVVSIYRDTELRNSLIANGLNYVGRNNWNTKIQDYVRLVDSLIGSPLLQNSCDHTEGKQAKSDTTYPLSSLYRIPEPYVKVRCQQSNDRTGYFLFGKDNICYGRYARGSRQSRPLSKLQDADQDVQVKDGTQCLPFDICETIDNLRQEKYLASTINRLPLPAVLGRSYYSIRTWLPTKLRRRLQRAWLSDWHKIPFPHWPVDTTVEKVMKKLIIGSLGQNGDESIPFIWFWPKGYSSCAVLTHDVESNSGRDFCPHLMEMEGDLGIRSSFQIVPEGTYAVPDELLRGIREKGFELNVHDLRHDGSLFRSENEFRKRAELINQYARQWGARGFRAAVMYHVLDWYDALEFSYDMSVPNAAHLEAQRGGCCTVFPYFIGDMLEIPLTTVQDYALFHYLGKYDTMLWKQQIDIIRSQNGLMSFLVHPDYVAERRGQAVYSKLLEHLCELRDSANVWLTCPGDVNDWWRARDRMKLVYDNSTWHIEGPRSDEACIAYARLERGELQFEIDRQVTPISDIKQNLSIQPPIPTSALI